MGVVKINALAIPAQAGDEIVKRFAAVERERPRPLSTGATLLEFEVTLTASPRG